MPDVLERLEEYGRHISAVTTPTDLDAVIDRVPHAAPHDRLVGDTQLTVTAPALSRRQLPSWAIAIAAAVFVLVVIGGTAWLIGGGDTVDRTPVTAPPPTTIPATETTPSTIPITRSLFPITLGDETVTDCCGWGFVSVDDPQLLAEGVALVVHPTFMAYTMGYLDDRFADVWISGDGTSWEQVILPGLLSEQGQLVEAELIAETRDITHGDLIARVNDIAVGGPGLVAVGYGLPSTKCETFPIPGANEPGAEAPIEGCIPQGTQLGVVWTSQDGRTWTKLPADPVFEGADIHGVASDGDAVVAVGFHHVSGERDSGDLLGDSVVWTSPDGITWTRLPHNQDLLGDSVMHRLVHGPAGYLGVGWALPKNDPAQSIYWLSPDGRDWTRVQLPDQLGETLPTALLADDTGYYVSVAYRDGDGPDWTSPDGITWTRLPAGSFPTQ